MSGHWYIREELPKEDRHMFTALKGILKAPDNSTALSGIIKELYRIKVGENHH